MISLKTFIVILFVVFDQNKNDIMVHDIFLKSFRNKTYLENKK